MSHKDSLIKLLLNSLVEDHIALKPGEKLVLSIIAPSSEDRGRAESERIIASYINTTKETLSTSRHELLAEQPETHRSLPTTNLPETPSATSAAESLRVRSTRKGNEEQDSLRDNQTSTTKQPKIPSTPAEEPQQVRSTRKGIEERDSLRGSQTSTTKQPKIPSTPAEEPQQARSTRKGIEERDSLRGSQTSTTKQPKAPSTPAEEPQQVRSTRKSIEERDSLRGSQTSTTKQPKAPSTPAVEPLQVRPARKGIEERDSLRGNQTSTTNQPKTISATLVAANQPRVQLARKGIEERGAPSTKQSSTTDPPETASTAPAASTSSRVQSTRRVEKESRSQLRDEVPDIGGTRRKNEANVPSSSSSNTVTVPSRTKASDNAISVGEKRKRVDASTQDQAPTINITLKPPKPTPTNTITAYSERISKFQIASGRKMINVFYYQVQPVNPGMVDYETARDIFDSMLELLMQKDTFDSDGAPLPRPDVELTEKTLGGLSEDIQTVARKFDEGCRTFLSMDRKRRGMTLREKLFMLELHRLGEKLDRCRAANEQPLKRRKSMKPPNAAGETPNNLLSWRVVENFKTKRDKESIDTARRKGSKLELFLENAGPSALFLLCLHSSTDKFVRSTNHQALAILMAMMQQKSKLLELLLDFKKDGWRQVLTRYVTGMDLKPGLEMNEKYPDNIVLQAKGGLKDGLQYSGVQMWATEESPRSYTDHVIFSNNVEDYESKKDMNMTQKLVEAMREECGHTPDIKCYSTKKCACAHCEKENLVALILVKEEIPILGIGAYCGQKRKKGDLVAEFGGILSSVSRSRMDDIEIYPGLFLQTDKYANESIYINYATDGDLTSAYTANVQMEVKLYERGGRLLPRVLLYAKRNIDIFERVLLDYGKHYRTDSLKSWSIPLHCRNDAF